jgi:hypothetical protein
VEQDVSRIHADDIPFAIGLLAGYRHGGIVCPAGGDYPLYGDKWPREVITAIYIFMLLNTFRRDDNFLGYENC